MLAEDDGWAVGSLLITKEWSDWRNGNFWWIQSVYVRPEARRRGVYRSLYRHVQALAAADRACADFASTWTRDNAAAQGTYGALGMKATRYLVFEELAGNPVLPVEHVPPDARDALLSFDQSGCT